MAESCARSASRTSRSVRGYLGVDVRLTHSAVFELRYVNAFAIRDAGLELLSRLQLPDRTHSTAANFSSPPLRRTQSTRTDHQGLGTGLNRAFS